MALSVAFLRDGERRTMPNGWGWFHLAAAGRAVESEGKTLSDCPVTVTEERRFKDADDGEELTFLVGDVIDCWR